MATASRQGVFSIEHEELAALTKELTDVPTLTAYLTKTIADKKSAAEVTDLVKGILTAAFALNASDIHIEPEEAGVRLRFRLDGELADVFTFDPGVYHFISFSPQTSFRPQT